MSVHHVTNAGCEEAASHGAACREHEHYDQCRDAVQCCDPAAKHCHSAAASHCANNSSHHPSEDDCLAFISMLSRSIKLIHRYLPFPGHSYFCPAEKQQRGA